MNTLRITTNRLAFLQALRSGKYKPMLYKLRDKECFCAEGVLADRLTQLYPKEYYWDYVKEKIKDVCEGDTPELYKFCVVQHPIYNSEVALRIDILKKELNFQSFYYRPFDQNYRSYISELYQLNDVYSLSFNEIADVLQRQWWPVK